MENLILAVETKPRKFNAIKYDGTVESMKAIAENLKDREKVSLDILTGDLKIGKLVAKSSNFVVTDSTNVWIYDADRFALNFQPVKVESKK